MSKKDSKNKLALNNLVERSNSMNEMLPCGMTLTEVRFLAIYQSKINARDPNTRTVTFPLIDFIKIMGIQKLNITPIKAVARSLLSKPVQIPSNNKSITIVPFFNKFQLFQDEKAEQWFVSIRCSEEIFPYMFEMKAHYFKYELWNALQLTSINQMRMYELLKQYEKIGSRTIELNELKAMLGLSKNQYSRYDNFKVKVLEPCQQALLAYTDIKYEYTPIKQGKAGKVVAIEFIISKNEYYIDKLNLKAFIDRSDWDDINDEDNTIQTITLSEESTAKDENARLYEYLKAMGKNEEEAEQLICEVHAIISDKLKDGSKIKDTYKYARGIIDKKLEQEKQYAANAKEKYGQKELESESYDIDEFESFAVNNPERTKRFLEDMNANNDLHTEAYQTH